MTHLHITSWVLALILFAVVLMFMKQGKAKPAKIIHMVLRLDYLVILVSGLVLLVEYFNLFSGALIGEVIVKAIAGFWVIYCMEMIPTKMKKGQPVNAWWIQLVIVLIIAIVLGFGRLPLGILPN